MRAWTLLIGIGFAAGCGGGGSKLEGMYMIDAWNVNPTSCADPGPSVLGDGFHTETVFYVKVENFLGEFLNAHACADLTECQTNAADDTTIYLGQFGSFSQGNDGDGWTETSSFGFTSGTDPTMCDGTVNRDSLTADGDAAVTIRLEIVHTPLYPMNGGMCTDEDALAAGQGQPCNEVETVHGTQIGGI